MEEKQVFLYFCFLLSVSLWKAQIKRMATMEMELWKESVEYWFLHIWAGASCNQLHTILRTYFLKKPTT